MPKEEVDEAKARVEKINVSSTHMDIIRSFLTQEVILENKVRLKTKARYKSYADASGLQG